MPVTTLRTLGKRSDFLHFCEPSPQGSDYVYLLSWFLCSDHDSIHPVVTYHTVWVRKWTTKFPYPYPCPFLIRSNFGIFTSPISMFNIFGSDKPIRSRCTHHSYSYYIDRQYIPLYTGIKRYVVTSLRLSHQYSLAWTLASGDRYTGKGACVLPGARLGVLLNVEIAGSRLHM